MTVILYIVGILLFLAAIGFSIGLHELGHLIPAKRFGVKVPMYMIGFGPTLFSFRKGETRYGVKLLPLGGFIAMPGMYPPKDMTGIKAQEVGGERSVRGIVRAAAQKTHRLDSAPEAPAASVAAPAQAGGTGGADRAGLMTRTLEDARGASNANVAPGDETRTFYALNIPRRLVVMFGGPFMNLILGIAILAVVLLGIGVAGPSTTVQTVVECAVPADEAQQRQAAGETECRDSDPLTPAWEAGIQPGDQITSINGTAITSWDQLSAEIRNDAGQTVPIEILRDGQPQTLEVPIITSERAVSNADGTPATNPDGSIQTEPAGFLGISPTQELHPMPVSEFPNAVGMSIKQTFTALFNLPQKLVAVGQVAFSDQERDAEGPIGVVGIGRVAGEIVSTDIIQVIDKVQIGLSLIASLNLFLFAFNLVPLLPLDGGHIAVALYEGARRRINLARGRGKVGPFDTARLLPLTYGVIVVMLAMTALLVYVDLFKPITLSDLFGG